MLDALDGVLIPQASNGELKSLLESVRPAVAGHLERVKQIRAELSSAK